MSTQTKQTDRGEKLQAAVRMLESGVEAILGSESFKAYLACMGRFHSYSYNNILLIHSQRPDATRVAGYKTWQSLNRQVVKGAKGIAILAPVIRKVENEETEDAVRVLSSFKVAWVFAYEDTEGEELPEPPVAAAIRTSSQPGQELYQRLLEYARSLGLHVEIADLGEANGAYQPSTGKVLLHERIIGTDHAPKTLCHELAHHLAQHRGWMDREDAESVAEATSYCVLQHYGLDTSGYSFGYVAGWAKDKGVLKRNLDSIQQTSSCIISALEGLEPIPEVHSEAA